jgi:hypothetical protein
MNDSEEAVTTAIMTMVGNGLRGEDRATVIETRTAAAGQLLAPVLKVLRETGLADAGFRAALRDQMPAVRWDAGDVSPAVRRHLVLARETVRDRVTGTPATPGVLLGYGHAVITLAGEPDVGSVSARALDGTGWELC